MRYFYITLALVCVTIVGIAGFRGCHSSRPPIELFSDMVRQPRIRPQTQNEFFPDRLGSRSQVKNSVPREPGPGEREPSYQDLPVNTGRVAGTTNFIEISPAPISRALLNLGQQRFDIHCSLCHGPSGDGKGIATRYGVIPANFHDKRLIEMSDGRIFDTITHGGASLMGAYGAMISIEERWAIVAYLRVLQRSQVATLDDVPENLRAALEAKNPFVRPGGEKP